MYTIIKVYKVFLINHFNSVSSFYSQQEPTRNLTLCYTKTFNCTHVVLKFLMQPAAYKRVCKKPFCWINYWVIYLNYAIEPLCDMRRYLNKVFVGSFHHGVLSNWCSDLNWWSAKEPKINDANTFLMQSKETLISANYFCIFFAFDWTRFLDSVNWLKCQSALTPIIINSACVSQQPDSTYLVAARH